MRERAFAGWAAARDGETLILALAHSLVEEVEENVDSLVCRPSAYPEVSDRILETTRLPAGAYARQHDAVSFGERAVVRVEL
jgi:hypothetical protein